MSKFINEEIIMAIGSGFIKPELLTTPLVSQEVLLLSQRTR